MKVWIKSTASWFRSHSLRLLGVCILLNALILLWLGYIPGEVALSAIVFALSLLGIVAKADQVREALAGVAASGVAYRAGDRIAAVQDLKPVVGVVSALPLTLTLTGETGAVLQAASALQAQPEVEG